MNHIVILLLTLFNFIGSHAQEVKEFDLVRDHVLTYGEELSRKKSKGKRKVTTVILKTVKREIQYLNYSNRAHIRIIHLPKESELPMYLVVKENNSISISAFFSRLDSEDDVLKRKDDWHELVYEIEVSKIPDHLLEIFGLGNYYWELEERVMAQKAYQKFVDLMKFEGLNEQIPKQVRERLFKCRYTNNKPKN